LSVQFLSQEYVVAANEALGGHAGFNGAIAGVDLALQFHVTEMPEGDDIAYYVDIAGGGATVGLGELDEPDVIVKNSYETAVGISKGDLNTQLAFMTGKLEVSGKNVAKLLLNQAVVNELTAAMSGLDTDY
jgi:putative sterol carrier protein